MTVPVPLTDIEAAAEKAQTGYPDGSPGPWVQMADADGMPGVWSSAARDFVCSDLTGLDAVYIAAADPPTVLALCKALRIADEGLDRVERWYVCANAPEDGSDFDTCRGCTDDPGEWCGWCAALDAIESVRELVDLGGDDG